MDLGRGDLVGEEASQACGGRARRERGDDEPVHRLKEVSTATEKPAAMAAAWMWRRWMGEGEKWRVRGRGSVPNPDK